MFSTMSGSHTEGRGNILDTPAVGFDFYNSCEQRLSLRYASSVVYQARWKRKDLTLEILLQEVGSNKIRPCDLELTLQPQPYDLSPVHRLSDTQPYPSTTPAVPRQPAPQ
jgi:hypothetical protein